MTDDLKNNKKLFNIFENDVRILSIRLRNKKKPGSLTLLQSKYREPWIQCFDVNSHTENYQRTWQLVLWNSTLTKNAQAQ